jgi:hypothetical protein
MFCTVSSDHSTECKAMVWYTGQHLNKRALWLLRHVSAPSDRPRISGDSARISCNGPEPFGLFPHCRISRTAAINLFQGSLPWTNRPGRRSKFIRLAKITARTWRTRPMDRLANCPRRLSVSGAQLPFKCKYALHGMNESSWLSLLRSATKRLLLSSAI